MQSYTQRGISGRSGAGYARNIGSRHAYSVHVPPRLLVSLRAASEVFDAQVAVVLGTQWGDEGKGKLVDILAQQYDIVARAQVCHRSINSHVDCKTADTKDLRAWLRAVPMQVIPFMMKKEISTLCIWFPPEF
jgi:hypothetical protein